MTSHPTPPLTWLITGSSRGIGLSLTRHVLSQGHSVIATSRNPSATPALVREITSAAPDGRGRWLQLDVTSPADIEAVVRDAGGRVDVVVNNAAYAVLGSVEEVPVEEYRRQMEVNLLGPVRVMQAVLPGMRARGSGWVVNVSSAAGIVAVAGNGCYSASKFALEAVTEAVGREVEGCGVRVVSMVLGAFRTGFGAEGARVVSPKVGGGYDGDHVVGRRLRDVSTLKERARGDPDKAAGMIFDVVMGREGVSGPGGRRLTRFVLGEDSWDAGWGKIEDLRETWEAQREYAKDSAVDE